ncbi:MAG: carboxypeptidase M32 [Acidobacteriota bacterium]
MPRLTAIDRLTALWGEVQDLTAAEQLLDWDQETQMPPAGHGARSDVASTIAGLKHRALVSDALHDSVEACADEAEEGSVLAAQVRAARREVVRARAVPEELARSLAAARSRGFAAWRQARSSSDFAAFAPALEELVTLRRRQAEALVGLLPAEDGAPTLYDAMLDEFEPGARAAELEPLFATLRAELTPLVAAVAEAPPVDESPLRGHFDPAAQRRLGLHAATGVGFEFDAGRLDPAAHPFCVGIAPSDVRLTWRWQDDDLRPGLFGILHETGHGLYEQGLPAELYRTPAGAAVSLGIHESQSRLWENHVGRSRGVWRWLAPTLRALFPDAPAAADVDRAWAALHVVRPSLIRVEADEVTYHLHVAARFELERALFANEVAVGELPGAWDDLYRSMLGVVADDVADGVLQDVHWSHGMFGYFPTYSLGSLAAAQLYAAAERDLGPLEERFEADDFATLLGWLRERVHRHGSLLDAGPLIEQATGTPLGAEALLADLRGLVAEVYGV